MKNMKKWLFLTFLFLCTLPMLTRAEEMASTSIIDMMKVWTGDFDDMVERRMIRVLVIHSKTFYFLDGVQPRGITYDGLKEFEKIINEQLELKTRQVRVVFIPAQRDELLPFLVEGQGDIAVANLTITSERQKLVDFSDPFLTGVDEILVTSPSAPPVTTLDDLAGKEMYVRYSSSYYGHLRELNSAFNKAGKPEMILNAADEYLEDEDLLEMVNAELIPMIVMDNQKANFWEEIFDNVTLHPEIVIHSGGEIAWAFRKNSPKLKEVINAFAKDYKKGTLMGNILLKRYLKDKTWVTNAASTKEFKKFKATVDFFRKYADMYGFSYLAVAAQGYEESGLNQSARSPAGAIGVMQLLPSTANDPAVGIPNIEELEPNIHAGVKYLKHLYETHFTDAEMDPINKGLFSFASYNAGPNRIAKLRQEAAERGLDPNVWFHNVELVVAENIGRETVQYVSNIFKYYLAYKRIVEQDVRKERALKEVRSEKPGDVVPVSPSEQANTETAQQPFAQATTRQLQERLMELGYNPGPVDGIWGKKTETTLKQFQEDNDLAVTGKLDEESKEKLGL